MGARDFVSFCWFGGGGGGGGGGGWGGWGKRVGVWETVRVEF